MIRSRRALAALVVVAATAAAAALPALPVAAQGQPTVKVVADGLLNPRGISVSADGTIYVAEAGAGGPTKVADVDLGPERPATVCVGKTGGVTQIRHGVQQRLVDLPSLADAAEDGSCNPAQIGFAATGPHDVALGGKGTLSVAIGLGGSPDARDVLAEAVPFATSFGTLGRVLPNSKTSVLADLAAYEGENDPDGAGPDSNPYSVAVLSNGKRLAVDAGGNTLLKVSGHGGIGTVAVFREVVRPVPELSCGPVPGLPPAGTPIPSQAVPTSVTVGPDGAYYVGQLTGFPFTPGAAKIYRIDPNTGAVSVFASGFTAIVDIAFGPDGSLYVVEIARHGLLEGEVCGDLQGALIKVSNGVRTEIPVPDLVAPGGVAVAKDGAVYVTNHSIFPGGGQVLQIRQV
jgi:hypothetical protein